MSSPDFRGSTILPGYQHGGLIGDIPVGKGLGVGFVERCHSFSKAAVAVVSGKIGQGSTKARGC